MQTDHIPAPCDHAPRKASHTAGIVGMLVVETDDSDARVWSDKTVEVRR